MRILRIKKFVYCGLRMLAAQHLVDPHKLQYFVGTNLNKLYSVRSVILL